MALFEDSERTFSAAVSKLSFANPFLKERVDLERVALGTDFDEKTRPFWSWTLNDETDRPNVVKLTERVANLANRSRAKIVDGHAVSAAEFELYDDIALYVIYYNTIAYGADPSSKRNAAMITWDKFSAEFDHWMNVDGRRSPSFNNKPHVYAYLSQLQRAFFNIFHCVVGRSWPIAQLRARIWQSIFTHDMRRYRSSLYNKMNEIATLVTGPSGTGKELVARAVGLSQYLPFDVKTTSFLGADDESFFAINLSACSPTLIESELFGHEKGSFTGATARRIGFLESAGRYGCVFLDEIGELDLAIQVKLLRVLQNREFQRIGDNKTKTFEGKIISATNRELMSEIETGKFREDFYYRLCSDVIVTPPLVDQLEDRPDEFEFLVKFLASRIAPGNEDSLTVDVMNWFDEKLPTDYTWPGNMRELEQCVRNIMIHNNYLPRTTSHQKGEHDELATRIRNLSLTADELVGHYCQIVYEKTKSYEKAASILNLDRRTVRAKIASIQS